MTKRTDNGLKNSIANPRALLLASIAYSGRSRPQNVLVRDCRLNCQVKTQHLSTCTGAHRGPPTGSWKEGGPTCALGSRRHEYSDTRRAGPDVKPGGISFLRAFSRGTSRRQFYPRSGGRTRIIVSRRGGREGRGGGRGRVSKRTKIRPRENITLAPGHFLSRVRYYNENERHAETCEFLLRTNSFLSLSLVIG